MKTCKWLFLLPIAAVLISCGSDSEEELIGNWEVRGEFGGPPRGYAATFTIGDKGYVCGGFNGHNKARYRDVWEYDNSGTGQWRQKTSLPDEAIARQQAVGFSINGKGYIGTGLGLDYSIVPNEEINLKDFWEFDPAGNGGAGSWRRVASLPDNADGTTNERRSAIAFSLKVGNKEYGYMGTGIRDSDMSVYMDFWRFDPTDGPEGKWTQIDSYNGNKRYGATAFVIDNKGYICTGKSTSTTVTDLWVFDPNAAEGSQWTQKRKMYPANQDEDYDDDYGDLPRGNAVSFISKAWGETRGYIALGGKSTVWEYSPSEDLWLRRTNYYNNGQGSSIREGAVAFSFPSTDQCFVGCGISGPSPYDDFREFFPTVEDNTNDDI